MTAFNSIKTNNWPSASNDLEDFLVLELPLNDQAALTSSRRDIGAGSTVLYPKWTLANTGVSIEAFDPNAGTTINIAASEYSTSGTVSNAGNLFDGDTSTTVSSADGARIYWTPASNISVTKFEVYFSSQYSGYKIGVEVTGGSSQVITKSNPGNSPGWVEFTSIAGDTIGPSNQIKFRSYRSNDSDPGILGINAVRVNDKIVTTAAAGTPKKHYDNNATFNGSASLLLADSGIVLGGDYCIETWFRATGSIAAHTRVFECQPTNFAFYIYDGPPRTYVQVGGNSTLNGGNNSFSLDTWHHFATTRQGSVTRLFIDGVQKASGSTTDSFDLGTSININGRTQGDYRWNGAMQDFRIYNGAAKYTSNFTPPGAILG